jgi:hypothetical protein
VKRALYFAAACAATIGAAWAIAVLMFPNATSKRGLAIAASVAFVVQMVAFFIAREFARRQNVMAGWGVGIALRFVVLLLFGFVAVPSLGLPMSSTLLGLAMFLFVSTLIEPLFLNNNFRK